MPYIARDLLLIYYSSLLSEENHEIQKNELLKKIYILNGKMSNVSLVVCAFENVVTIQKET